MNTGGGLLNEILNKVNDTELYFFLTSVSSSTSGSGWVVDQRGVGDGRREGGRRIGHEMEEKDAYEKQKRRRMFRKRRRREKRRV